MKLIPSNGIHQGAREEQQDDFGFSDLLNAEFVRSGGVLALVVDGMGGVTYGAECARVGKSTFLHAYEAKSRSETIDQALERCLHAANDAVLAIARRAGDPKSVGATLCAAVISGESLTWISVGDSAVFLYRSGSVRRLTRPHETSGEDGQTYVSSFLGLPQITLIDRPPVPLQLQTGDRVVVCSDGLFKTLSDAQIALALSQLAPGDAGTGLVDAALAMGMPGQDNVTAIVLSCEPDRTPSPLTADHAPPRRRLGLVVAALLALTFLSVTLGAAYGWHRYRTGQREMQAKLLAEFNTAVANADCAGLAEQKNKLSPDVMSSPEIREKELKCQRYSTEAQNGTTSLGAAEVATDPAEKKDRAERAISHFERAQQEDIGTEARRQQLDELLRKARDIARTQPEAPPEPQTTPAPTVAPQPSDDDFQDSNRARRRGRPGGRP